MDFIDYARYLGALFITLALLGALLLALRRFGPGLGLVQLTRPGGRVRRMEVAETLLLDARRRLVLVRADGREHLLLLGSAETLIESRPAPPEEPAP